MNKQINYIIQGFLLFLLIPIGGFLISKISSIEKNNESKTVIIDHETSPGTVVASNGKSLFIQKCAPCHNVLRDGTGPALTGFEERGLWADRKKLYEWIRNPSAFMEKDPYTRSLKTRSGSVMTAFPDLKNEEIDAIVEYINQSESAGILPIAKR